MKKLLLISLFFIVFENAAQVVEQKNPFINLRLSLLVFPPISPLLTVEFATFKNTTIQLETNFVNTHGINLKYFMNQTMKKNYLFLGTAFLKSDFLRKDLKIAFLPYAGCGFAQRFGKTKDWIFDSRIGLGYTINADKNIFTPVIKTGIGKTF